MKVQLLIEAIVQQTTVLIAKLATAGGARAPLSHVANQVFVELASELERQGLSRKVTADMFGISLRAYQRKMQRLRESRTERGRSLWEVALEYLKSTGVVSRRGVLERFSYDDEDSVRSILHDLVESGLVFCTGTGAEAVYRAASDDELGDIRRLDEDTGLDELVWSLVFSRGPLSGEQLENLCGAAPERLQPVLERLIASQRIQRRTADGGEMLVAERFYIAPGEAEGWEAAVYDHYRAVVRTICNRLEMNSSEDGFKDSVGGSTYTFDVGPGHPLEGEVLALLGELRRRCASLRERVALHNVENGRVEAGENVVVYLGQSVVPRENLSGEEREEQS